MLRELPEELLVYDTETHEAHCLNTTAAFVWQQRDGTKSVSEIADGVRASFETEMDDEVVWSRSRTCGSDSFSRGRQRLLAKAACPGRRC